MRVLVTRPAREAAETAARLNELGHEVIVSPVLDVVATEAPLPDRPYDAVLATSAQAFEVLTDAQVARLAGLPLHLVGSRTRAAAEARGLGPVASLAADGARLAESLREAGWRSRNVLYLAGKDRKSGLEEACAKLDCTLTVVEIYEARGAAALMATARNALRDRSVDAVLHFSRRSADLFLSLCDADGLRGALARPRHVCLSADVAVPLQLAGLAVVIAASATAASLFEALETG